MAVDQNKLTEFIGRFVADLGATSAAGNVVVGHRLGLYRALATGPATPEQLAERTETDPRYITEWLRGQAAGGYVDYQPATGLYAMTEEQAFALDSAAPQKPPSTSSTRYDRDSGLACRRLTGFRRLVTSAQSSAGGCTSRVSTAPSWTSAPATRM